MLEAVDQRLDLARHVLPEGGTELDDGHDDVGADLAERVTRRQIREACGVDLSGRFLEANRVGAVAHREHLVEALVVLGAVRRRRLDPEPVEDRVERRQTDIETVERLGVPGELRVDTTAVARGEFEREARLVTRPQDEPVLAGGGDGVEPLLVRFALVCHLDVVGAPDTERIRLPVDHVERGATVLLVEADVRRVLVGVTDAVSRRVVTTGCVVALRFLRVLVRAGQTVVETLGEVERDVTGFAPEHIPLRQVRRRNLRVPTAARDGRREVLPGVRRRLRSRHTDEVVLGVDLAVELEAQRRPGGLAVLRVQLARRRDLHRSGDRLQSRRVGKAVRLGWRSLHPVGVALSAPDARTDLHERFGLLGVAA